MKTNEEVKVAILEVLKKVTKPGIGDLIEYLTSSNCDYFTAPASTRFHDSEIGGLARHSLLTYNILKKKIDIFGLEIPEDTIAICGLLHDACKINQYKEKPNEPISASQVNYLADLTKIKGEEKDKLHELTKSYASLLIDYYKKGAVGEIPQPKTDWELKDSLPLGHGEKSLIVLQKFINLTDEEILAIRWHMGFSESSVHLHPNNLIFNTALEKTPLVMLMSTSDFEASQMSKIFKNQSR